MPCGDAKRAAAPTPSVLAQVPPQLESAGAVPATVVTLQTNSACSGLFTKWTSEVDGITHR
ncbi:MAG: hypothetical protein BWX86_02091 [Verrucomicrobia bacterium ADurb.Bin122]|nr:MAG: hypothetical protein BWX86_02091 [Verrucomicrobia bacterium ADurb.Bin122]